VYDCLAFLQTRWRGYKAWSSYKKLQRGVLVAQCLYRGRLARRELRKLKLVSPHMLCFGPVNIWIPDGSLVLKSLTAQVLCF
jgi:hypothetical protein